MKTHVPIKEEKIIDAIFQVLLDRNPMGPYQLLATVMQEIGCEVSAPVRKQYRILLQRNMIKINHDMLVVYIGNDPGITMKDKSVGEVENYYRRK